MNPSELVQYLNSGIGDHVISSRSVHRHPGSPDISTIISTMEVSITLLIAKGPILVP